MIWEKFSSFIEYVLNNQAYYGEVDLKNIELSLKSMSTLFETTHKAVNKTTEDYLKKLNSSKDVRREITE